MLDRAVAIYAATAADVTHVVIDGTIVVHDGRHATIDVGSALASAITPLWQPAAVVPASSVMPAAPVMPAASVTPASSVMPLPFDPGGADDSATASLDEPITLDRPDAR